MSLLQQTCAIASEPGRVHTSIKNLEKHTYRPIYLFYTEVSILLPRLIGFSVNRLLGFTLLKL